MGWYLLDYPPRSAKTVMAFGILGESNPDLLASGNGM